MYTIEYLPIARRDMVDIAKYIGVKLANPDAAERLATCAAWRQRNRRPAPGQAAVPDQSSFTSTFAAVGAGFFAAFFAFR